jgi:putative polyhydroxyalkanoate system protein
MADIELNRKHAIGLKKAKAAAQKVADELAEKFDVSSQWAGNTLEFERSGISGALTVTKDTVAVHAKLGFLLSAFKPKIEAAL